MNSTDGAALEYIKSDLFRYMGKTDFRSLVVCYRRNRGFRFQFWFRLVHVRSRIVRKLARFMRNRLAEKYVIHIHPDTKIGYGLYLSHGTSVVVSPRAEIGNNCNLSQFTTIGAQGLTPAARIGDCVYIGPNVAIVNSVRVGNHVRIGAGAVVVKDAPENATVVGNPARVIEKDERPELPANPWPIGLLEAPKII